MTIKKIYPKKNNGQIVGWKKIVIIPPTPVKKDPKRLEILQ